MAARVGSVLSLVWVTIHVHVLLQWQVGEVSAAPGVISCYQCFSQNTTGWDSSCYFHPENIVDGVASCDLATNKCGSSATWYPDGALSDIARGCLLTAQAPAEGCQPYGVDLEECYTYCYTDFCNTDDSTEILYTEPHTIKPPTTLGEETTTKATTTIPTTTVLSTTTTTTPTTSTTLQTTTTATITPITTTDFATTSQQIMSTINKKEAITRMQSEAESDSTSRAHDTTAAKSFAVTTQALHSESTADTLSTGTLPKASSSASTSISTSTQKTSAESTTAAASLSSGVAIWVPMISVTILVVICIVIGCWLKSRSKNRISAA